MAYRTRLVLATTAAVVVVALLASGAALYFARNTSSQGADNSLTIAAQKIREGQSLRSTTATLGQVIDSRGAVVAGGGLTVPGQARLVAGGVAPTFFTTLTVNGKQMREVVEHLPRGTTVKGGVLSHGGALQVASPFHATSEPPKLPFLLAAIVLAGILLAVILVWLLPRTGSRRDPQRDIPGLVESDDH